MQGTFHAKGKVVVVVQVIERLEHRDSGRTRAGCRTGRARRRDGNDPFEDVNTRPHARLASAKCDYHMRWCHDVRHDASPSTYIVWRNTAYDIIGDDYDSPDVRHFFFAAVEK